MTVSTIRVKEFQKTIFTWWPANRRDLPWRKTSDPYSILVSEVMLQQTQVPRVLPKYARFLELFPTVRSLAVAPASRVVIAWKGMGYNRRALYLQKSAKAIVQFHGGLVPDTEESLLSLPGIGKYTARAVMVFAFRKDIALVDTNIRQIITHYFFKGVRQPERIIQSVADRLLPAGKSWEWHQALMDFGALQMPMLKGRQGRHQAKGNQIPFRQTMRFMRGKIIDVLREGPVRESDLTAQISSRTEKPIQAVITQLRKLESEGLICSSDGIVRLAD